MQHFIQWSQVNNRNTLASYLYLCHVPCVLSLLPYLTFAAPSPYVSSSSPPLAVLSPPLSSYVHVLTSEITITATTLCAQHHTSHWLPSAIHNLNNTQYTAQTVDFTLSELCIVICICERGQQAAPLSHYFIPINISINSNQLTHISVFIKNTLKVYLKFLLPRHVSDHRGIHPQGAIIRS